MVCLNIECFKFLSKIFYYDFTMIDFSFLMLIIDLLESIKIQNSFIFNFWLSYIFEQSYDTLDHTINWLEDDI